MCVCPITCTLSSSIQGLMTLKIKANLSSVFSWNTKQVCLQDTSTAPARQDPGARHMVQVLKPCPWPESGSLHF